jgi:hypothetical protein
MIIEKPRGSHEQEILHRLDRAFYRMDARKFRRSRRIAARRLHEAVKLFRTEADAQQHFPLMILAHVILAGALVWIYSRGVEATPWLPQGIRFGVAVALLTIVPTYMIYYVVQPMPGMTVVKQIVFDGILMLILGVVVAFMYRTPARS